MHSACKPSWLQVPEDVYKTMDKTAAGAAVEAEWNARMATYKSKYPKEAAELAGLLSRELPAGWEKALPSFKPGAVLALLPACCVVVLRAALHCSGRNVACYAGCAFMLQAVPWHAPCLVSCSSSVSSALSLVCFRLPIMLCSRPPQRTS